MSLRVSIKKRLGAFSLNADFSSENDKLALLGGSGSGKSVTLRCIAGIMKPDEGHIELDGKILFDSSKGINLPPQKRHIGYLFQQYALFPNMTAQQNIEVAVRDKSKREETAVRLLKMFRLEDAASRHPAQLSGGQQQRLALARILASEPNMLMLDEPFSALDSYLKTQLEQELTETLGNFGGDIIWVTHDRDEVFRNCTRICVIDAGKTQPVVTPEELFHDPKTASAAKLSGCKNIVKAVPNGNSVVVPCWGTSLACTINVPSEISAIGLRAHKVHLAQPEDVNIMPCSVVRVADNVFSTMLVLRPLGSVTDAPVLFMETDAKKTEFWNTENITVAIAPEDILLLR